MVFSGLLYAKMKSVAVFGKLLMVTESGDNSSSVDSTAVGELAIC